MFNYSPQTIGNHEFDHGVEGLIPFLETIDPHTKIVVANLDISEEPGLQGLYSHTHVIDRYERRIGIIGVILQTTNVSHSIYCYLNNCP